MPPKPIIRVATLADLSDIEQIWSMGIAQALPGWTLNQPTEVISQLNLTISSQSHPFGVWVATDFNGYIIGWQSLMPCRNNPLLRSKLAESSTYVRRRSSIPNLGRILLLHALSHAQATELQYILGFVGVENRSAIRMVTACNFKLVGKLPAPEKPPVTGEVYIFCKTLGTPPTFGSETKYE